MNINLTFSRLVSILAILLSTYAPVSVAETNSGNMTEIIAALTYNFAKYTAWPVSHSASPSLCFFDPSYETGFRQLEGKPIHDLPLLVTRINNVTQAEACHVIYLSEADKDRMKRLMLALADRPVLTISALPGFIAQGGMIELFQENNKFRFDVDNQKVKQAQLKLSAQVLKLARTVR